MSGRVDRPASDAVPRPEGQPSLTSDNRIGAHAIPLEPFLNHDA
jgi:hypothetical protein